MKLSEKIKMREWSFETRLRDHILIRIDGKNFSRYTRNFTKPFDERMVSSMKEVTRYLMSELGAQTGYTQSDEITLFLKQEEDKDHYLGGRLQKLCSVSAACATAAFAQQREEKRLGDEIPVFDSRVCQVEDLRDVICSFIWREMDCIRNSVNILAQQHFSHKQLFKKSTDTKKEMLRAKGVIWEDLPKDYKYGTYFVKTKTKRPFTPDEIDKLPPKHVAREDPGMEIERNDIVEVVISGYKNFKGYGSMILEGKL